MAQAEQVQAQIEFVAKTGEELEKLCIIEEKRLKNTSIQSGLAVQLAQIVHDTLQAEEKVVRMQTVENEKQQKVIENARTTILAYRSQAEDQIHELVKRVPVTGDAPHQEQFDYPTNSFLPDES